MVLRCFCVWSFRPEKICLSVMFFFLFGNYYMLYSLISLSFFCLVYFGFLSFCFMCCFESQLTKKCLLYFSFLFFATIAICKKNYSFSRVVFFSPNLPTLFVQKLLTAVGLGQQRSQAVGLGFKSMFCQIFLRFILNIFWYPNLVKH